MQACLAGMDSADPGASLDALDALCELVCGAFGDDGLIIGATVRAEDAVSKLVRMLTWYSASVVEPARGQPPSSDGTALDGTALAICSTLLVLLANLASDAVDPKSHLTKEALLASGGLQAFVGGLFSEVRAAVEAIV